MSRPARSANLASFRPWACASDRWRNDYTVRSANRAPTAQEVRSVKLTLVGARWAAAQIRKNSSQITATTC